MKQRKYVAIKPKKLKIIIWDKLFTTISIFITAMEIKTAISPKNPENTVRDFFNLERSQPVSFKIPLKMYEKIKAMDQAGMDFNMKTSLVRKKLLKKCPQKEAAAINSPQTAKCKKEILSPFVFLLSFFLKKPNPTFPVARNSPKKIPPKSPIVAKAVVTPWASCQYSTPNCRKIPATPAAVECPPANP